MKARAILTILAAIVAVPLSARTANLLARDGATVLCYHIVESPLDPRMEISRETFLQQMHYLAATGYNVVSLRDAYDYAVGKRDSLPKNSIVITIDDGWRSTYTEVFPEMKRLHFPFTVFIYPRIIGQTSYALTWKQVREMADAGVDIESHSFSHPFLTRRRNRDLDDHRYAEWLDRELEGSKKMIEQETGKTVNFIAYPYGDYDHYLVAKVARAGYGAALTCDFGRVTHNSDPLRMKRVVIDKTMDFAAFRHYLGAGTMTLEAMTPHPGEVLDVEPTATITAKIPNYKSVDPTSVGIALMSSVGGTVPYSYDPRDGSVSLTIKEALKGTWQRALVWATDTKTGKRLEAVWSFRLPMTVLPPADCPPVEVPGVPSPTVARTTGGGTAATALHGSGRE